MHLLSPQNFPIHLEILDFLDAHHIKKAVATTTRREFTEERLKRVGVYDHFDYVLCGDEVTNHKPDPEIYLSVLNPLLDL